MSTFLSRLLSKPAGPPVIAPTTPPDPLATLRAQVAASAIQTANLTSQVTAMTAERDQFAARVAALTAECDQLRAQTARTREDLTTEIRNQELARIAAGQGIPPGQVPPTDSKDKGAETSWQETHAALSDPMARSANILKALKL